MADEVVFDGGAWTREDFELMALWYGVDADDLIERATASSGFERRYGECISGCWSDIEDAAVELGGRAEDPFDFLDAQERLAEREEQAFADRYLPGLSGEAASGLRIDGRSLVDRDGNRFELALVSEGREFFVCPELRGGRKGVLGCELADGGKGLSVVLDGEAAEREYGALMEDYATLRLVPDFASGSAEDEAGRTLSSDARLMMEHDANLPDAPSAPRPGRRPRPASPSAEELAGYPMTALLREAYEASAALGADPGKDALARYDRAMREVEARIGAAPVGALEVGTSLGTLVASPRGGDPGVYDCISIDLEKPDGTSGQVAVVEVVSGEAEGLYPTRLHTFAFDGADEEPRRVDCDPRGEFMQEVGWKHGEHALPENAGERARAYPSPAADSSICSPAARAMQARVRAAAAEAAPRRSRPAAL